MKPKTHMNVEAFEQCIIGSDYDKAIQQYGHHTNSEELKCCIQRVFATEISRRTHAKEECLALLASSGISRAAFCQRVGVPPTWIQHLKESRVPNSRTMRLVEQVLARATQTTPKTSTSNAHGTSTTSVQVKGTGKRKRVVDDAALSEMRKSLKQRMRNDNIVPWNLKQKGIISSSSLNRLMNGEPISKLLYDRIQLFLNGDKAVKATPARKRERKRKLDGARAVVRKQRDRALKAERPTEGPGPRADVLREIILKSKDVKLCQFMSELQPIVRKYNGTSEAAIQLLHMTAQEGLPLPFVIGAMAQ